MLNNYYLLMDYYHYIIFFFTIIIIFRFYVKLKYKFWAYQPVFHYYNILYWLYPVGIIDNNLPETNKYCNFINTTTKNFFDYNKDDVKEIVKLIRNNYNRNSDANYLPDKDSFSQHFISHIHKCYLTVYNDILYKLDKNNNITKKNNVIGVITGRPINITLKKAPKMLGYYVDFLCVDKDNRKKNIAPQLIQTYEYCQRHNNKESSISLFKREGVLTGIVPLTVYKSYLFYTTSIKSQSNLPINNFIEISEVNFDLLIDYIDLNKDNFDCIITVCKSNLQNLILKNIYKVFGIISNNRLVACYFFKENNIIYNDKCIYENSVKKHSSIDLVLSINNIDNNLFYDGFCKALEKLKKYYINIENISDNNIIINILQSKLLKPKIVAPMAYFFYNYAKRPIESKNIIVIV